jgi:hypothetical protein
MRKNFRSLGGRPSVFSAEEQRQIKSICRDGRTKRQAANIIYGRRAADILRRAANPERFAWLFHRGGRATILTALGRLGDPAKIEAQALEFCEIKPRSESVPTLLGYLESEAAPREARRLSALLLDTLAAYQLRRPEITYEEAADALQEAARQLAALNNRAA